VVPFVLIVVLFAVGGQLLGPLLQQLRGKSEYVEYAARVMDFVGLMSDKDSDGESSDEAVGEVRDTSTSQRAARRPGVSDPSAVPRDLPLHPNAFETLSNVGPSHILVYQRVSGLRDAAIGQLRERMGQQGWKLVSETPGDWSTIIRWSKGTRNCMVEFTDDSGATEIWIRSMVPGSHRSTAPSRQ
jgi:hypothetical protein